MKQHANEVHDWYMQVPVYCVYKWQCDPGIRDLKIWEWQHQWKRPWKTDIASFQTFCNYLSLISLLIVGKLSCRWRVRTASKLSRDTVKVIPLSFLFLRELEMWSFHIIAAWGWLQNWQKSVTHMQGCYIIVLIKIILFLWCSHCHHHHSFIRSLYGLKVSCIGIGKSLLQSLRY